MTESLPPLDIPTPKFVSDLVPLPYQQTILLDPQTHTRWKRDGDTLERDLVGESEWESMAGYVGKTYNQVFMESYRFALDTKNAS
tara:strand:+ start:177 stop:431 length:255 start_codon:yes stop_codon:yes gene_type:complete